MALTRGQIINTFKPIFEGRVRGSREGTLANFLSELSPTELAIFQNVFGNQLMKNDWASRIFESYKDKIPQAEQQRPPEPPPQAEQQRPPEPPPQAEQQRPPEPPPQAEQQRPPEPPPQAERRAIKTLAERYKRAGDRWYRPGLSEAEKQRIYEKKHRLLMSATPEEFANLPDEYKRPDGKVYEDSLRKEHARLRYQHGGKLPLMISPSAKASDLRKMGYNSNYQAEQQRPPEPPPQAEQQRPPQPPPQAEKPKSNAVPGYIDMETSTPPPPETPEQRFMNKFGKNSSRGWYQNPPTPSQERESLKGMADTMQNSKALNSISGLEKPSIIGNIATGLGKVGYGLGAAGVRNAGRLASGAWDVGKSIAGGIGTAAEAASPYVSKAASAVGGALKSALKWGGKGIGNKLNQFGDWLNQPEER